MDISLLEYFVPWSRYQPYGIGVLTGCILWELKDRQVTFPVVRMKAYRIPPKSKLHRNYHLLYWKFPNDAYSTLSQTMIGC